MMSPQDVLQGQRAIAPRSMGMQRLEGSRGGRDEKRRATHNEGTSTATAPPRIIFNIIGAKFIHCTKCKTLITDKPPSSPQPHLILFISITVERRRRDKINNWIVQLSKLIPDCSDMKQVGVAKVCQCDK